MAQFTWLPFFEEMLDVICRRYNKDSLCEVFHKVFAKSGGISTRFQDGNKKLHEEIDPLTFIGSFNKQMTDKNRIHFCQEAKEVMELKSEVPDDFNAIPRLNNMNVWFFSHSDTREEDAIEHLWNFSMELNTLDISGASFTQVLNIFRVGLPKLTTLMFLCKPKQFISLDNTNVDYFAEKGFHKDRKIYSEIKNDNRPFEKYKSIVTEIKEYFNGKTFYEISQDAFEHRTSISIDDYEEMLNNKFEFLKERFDSRVSGFIDFQAPGDFFQKQELAYKRKALERYQSEVGNQKLEQWLHAGEGQKARQEISKRLGTNLVQFNSWRQSIGASDEHSSCILKAFLEASKQDFIGKETILPIFEETNKQGLKPAWDTFSTILWALKPETYVPIKIRYFRALAEEIGIQLPKGRITPDKFENVFNWMRAFWRVLESHGYKPNDWVDVHSFIWCVCPGTYETLPELDTGDTKPEDSKAKYWVIAPGPNARFWDEFKENGMIAIGWDKTGDLVNYTSKETIREKLVDLYGETLRNNDALAMWEFYDVMKVNDLIFAKKGTSEIIGYGRVVSHYIYDSTRETYQHVRKVKWLSEGNWKIPKEEDAGIPLKTLTDVTNHEVFLEKILPLVKTSQAITSTTEKGYWWLNANPKIWNFVDMEIGAINTYTSHNQKGNKRRIYKYFEEAKPGDILLGYVASPDREIIALCEVTKGLHKTDEGAVIEFAKKEQLDRPITLKELQGKKELASCEPLVNNQGSLFKVTPEEYDIIRDIIDEKNPPEKKVEFERYSKSKAMEGLFISENKFTDILDGLAYRKNIVLQGPPGVGKTFIAKRLAYTLMGKKDDSRVQMIQFHQSYSYEDFMQGFRPNDEGNFDLQNGIFYEFCKKAQRDKENKHIFIIDEINRGNLSKIFGELMMLIEPDKRGPSFAVPLTYSKSRDETFYLPENLYLIGTMNTADRSLAIVDYALRRRFCFIELEPRFGSSRFKDYLAKHGVLKSTVDNIVERMNYLNGQISKDEKNLGPGYQIGHSFFCPDGKRSEYDEEWYKLVIHHEIEPLIKEYWFDNNDKAKAAINALLR